MAPASSERGSAASPADFQRDFKSARSCAVASTPTSPDSSASSSVVERGIVELPPREHASKGAGELVARQTQPGLQPLGPRALRGGDTSGGFFLNRSNNAAPAGRNARQRPAKARILPVRSVPLFSRVASQRPPCPHHRRPIPRPRDPVSRAPKACGPRRIGCARPCSTGSGRTWPSCDAGFVRGQRRA